MAKRTLSDYESTESDDDSFESDSTLANNDPTLLIHPLASQDGVIVKVDPPRLPANPNISRIPCDIVLVIDVSESMGRNAPAPMTDSNGKNTLEDFGLSVLDLTKHAACTILETLQEGDRLGIVTFQRDVHVSLITVNALIESC